MGTSLGPLGPRWADGLAWSLTVAEADRIAEILEPLGIGCAISGDDRPRFSG